MVHRSTCRPSGGLEERHPADTDADAPRLLPGLACEVLVLVDAGEVVDEGEIALLGACRARHRVITLADRSRTTLKFLRNCSSNWSGVGTGEVRAAIARLAVRPVHRSRHHVECGRASG